MEYGIVLVTLQLLLSSPLINIWSPDCLLPVLGGCDGRWAGLGSTSVSSKHPFFIFRGSVQCSAVQCGAVQQTSHTSLHVGDPGIQRVHRGVHCRAPPWSIWFLETNLLPLHLQSSSSPRQECQVGGPECSSEVPSCGGRIPAAARNKEETSQTRDTAYKQQTAQSCIYFTEGSEPSAHP